jgi:autotransporter-associated beta strand protein
MSSFSKYQGSQPVFKRLALLLAFSLAALFSTTIQVQAQNVTYTWQNANGSWTNTTTAWSPTTGPQLSSTTNNTDTALFSNVGANFNAVSLTSNRTVYGLLFSSTANAYTFTSIGRDLSVMSNLGLTNNSSQVQTFNTAVANSGATGLWTSVAGGSLVFNSGVNLTTSSSSASRTLILAGAGTITVNSTIANGGTATAGIITVTSTGSTNFLGNNTYGGLTTMNGVGGTLTLSGNNSGAAGGVTLTAGTLNINHASALGTGALTISANATINNTSGAAVINAANQSWVLENGLTFGTANSTSANNLDLGTGNVTLSTSRTITFAGTNTTLSMGSATITSGSSSRILTANGVGNTLVLSGLSISQNATGNATAVLAGTANIKILGPIVSGLAPNNGISITNTGTTTFNGTNTYTGATTISAGTLALSGSLDGSSVIINGGTLNQTSAGLIAGGSATLAVSSGTATLAGNNTYGGGTTLNAAGTLNINHEYALGSGSLLNTGGTINNTSGRAITLATTNAQSWNGTITFLGTNDLNLGTGSVTMSNDRIVSVNAGNLTIGGAIAEASSGKGLTKNGSGTLLLTGNNTYTGPTTINAGTLFLTGNNTSTGNTIINAGVLNVAYLNNSLVSGPLGNTSDANVRLQLGDGTLQYTGSNATSSDRGFRIIGNATFDASGNGAGATMSMTKTGSVDSLFSGNKILTLTGSNTGSNLISATMGDNSSVNTLAVVKSGEGTWIMGGTNTYTGSTIVTAGKLYINGSISTSSAVNVDGGLLGGNGTIGGSVTVNSGASIAGGVNGVGTLTLSNSLTLSDNSTFSAGIGGSVAGTEYSQVLVAGAVTLNGANNLALTLNYTPTDQQLFFLTAGATSITGSFDSLNGVSVALAQGSSFTLGDQQFIIGYSGNSAAGTFQGGNDLVLQASAVPEPSTWALLGLGLLSALLLVRRQKTPAPR